MRCCLQDNAVSSASKLQPIKDEDEKTTTTSSSDITTGRGRSEQSSSQSTRGAYMVIDTEGIIDSVDKVRDKLEIEVAQLNERISGMEAHLIRITSILSNRNVEQNLNANNNNNNLQTMGAEYSQTDRRFLFVTENETSKWRSETSNNCYAGAMYVNNNNSNNSSVATSRLSRGRRNRRKVDVAPVKQNTDNLLATERAMDFRLSSFRLKSNIFSTSLENTGLFAKK